MRHMFASLALAAALAPLAPAALAAQSPAAATEVVSSSAVSMSATAPAPDVALAAEPSSAQSASSVMIRNDVAGVHTTVDDRAPLVVSSAAASGLHQGEGVALMAVGGAGLIGGLLIGGGAGTAVALGGLAVGLVGLYEYVR